MERDKVSEHLLAGWDKCLRQFTENLIPSDLYIQKGTEAVKKVIQALQQTNKTLSINRECISGSMGKKTSIKNSDFDSVVFLNDKLPPFTDVLDNFEKVLKTLPKVDNLKCTNCSVQFIAEGGFEIDLLPAANLVRSNTQLAHPKLADVQASEVIKIIQQDPKRNSYIYSSSACEAQLHFMREQDEFAHMLVRLAKYWYQSLYFGNIIISGAKMLIELVALAAAQKESEFEKKSPLRAFRRFLEMIQRFKSLRIVFESKKALSEKDVDDLKNGRQRLSPSPPPSTLSKQNFVLDPVNPFNDLTEKWSKESIEMIQMFAETTSSRIKKLLDGSTPPGPSAGIPYPLIFEQQPKVLLRAASVGLPRFICGVYGDNDSGSFCPTRDIKNNNRFKTPEMKDFLFGCLAYLKVGVSSLAASKPDITSGEMQTAIEALIDDQLCGRKSAATSGTPARRSHDNYDCTLIVPYENKSGTKYSVVVSLDWS